jgi:hypothetical protein
VVGCCSMAGWHMLAGFIPMLCRILLHLPSPLQPGPAIRRVPTLASSGGRAPAAAPLCTPCLAATGERCTQQGQRAHAASLAAASSAGR